MKRNKLSTKQSRNVKERHHKLLQENSLEAIDENCLGAMRDGIVISRYGKQVDIEDAKTRIMYRCFIRRTIDDLATGDKVLFRIDEVHNAGTNGLVETVKQRTSQLSRPDYYDGLKTVVANVTKIVIVSAKEPEFSTNILDRYLIACHCAHIAPIIVINKAELFTESELVTLENICAVYRQLGFQVLFTSTVANTGIAELKKLLASETTVLVGQSGVGKSSLLNALLPEANAQTNIISDTSGLGQHTTTNTRLYHFQEGGIIIDSPGVREFALWHLTAEEVTNCYPEFTPYLGLCKFRDCKHLTDPGCALVQAVQEGHIAQFRFNNYHRIIDSMIQNKPDAYVAPGKKYGKK